MKSLLVDALRQAAESKSLDETGDRHPVDEAKQDSSLVANEEFSSKLSEKAELELLESTGALLLGDADETSETGELQVLPEEGHSTTQELNPATDAAQMPEVVSGRRLDKALATRLGAWSPLLCAVALVASALSFWGYRQLGGDYQNSDLRLLSSKTSGQADGLLQFAPDSNPFPLIVTSVETDAGEGSDEL
jgi:hypothetical protein